MVQDAISTITVEIKVHPGISADSFVIVYLHGTELSMPSELPPQPCIEVKMHCGGKGLNQARNASAYKRTLPEALVEALTIVRQWADSAHIRRRVALWCFSRGAAWGLQICSAWSSLIDFAWLFAGYPSTHEEFNAMTEARVTLQCDIPMVLVNCTDDAFCNVRKFPTWFMAFRAAVISPPSRQLGHRREHIYWFELPGTHDYAHHLYSRFCLHQCGSNLAALWTAFWSGAFNS